MYFKNRQGENYLKIDERIIRALEEKALEHAKALSLWVQQEFNLPPEHYVTIKVTLKVAPPARILTELRQNSHGLVFDQQPNPEDWVHVINEVKTLSTKAKPYQRSKRVWARMLEELNSLRQLNNVAYVNNATRFNVHFENNNLPYQLIRVDKPGDGTLYSLLVAACAVGTP